MKLSTPVFRSIATLICAFVIFQEVSVFAEPNAMDLFPSTLSAAEISKLSEKYKVSEMIADFEIHKDGHPVSGKCIASVLPDSQIKNSGIRVGDAVIRRGDRVFADFYTSSNEQDNRMPAGDLVWVCSADHQRHVTKVEEGPVGIKTLSFANMTNWYLHYGQRNKAWDRLVVTALLSQGTEVKAASSCWAAALAAGYQPDHLSNWAGMIIAVAQGDSLRVGKALDGYGKLCAPSDEKDFPLQVEDSMSAALLSGNARQIVAVCDAFTMFSKPNKVPHRFAELQFKLQSLFPPDSARPTEIAAGMKRVPILRKMESQDSHHCIEQLHARGAAVETLPNPTFAIYTADPPADRFSRVSLKIPDEC